MRILITIKLELKTRSRPSPNEDIFDAGSNDLIDVLLPFVQLFLCHVGGRGTKGKKELVFGAVTSCATC